MRQRHPVMRGWAQSHPPGARQRTFATGAPHLLTLGWGGARRRHPRQSRWGSKENYCRSAHGNHWGCVGQSGGPQGNRQDGRLFRAVRVPIRRHSKLTGAAHPAAPQGEPSCASRLDVRMARALQGRRHLLRLWKAPEGRGPVCPQRLTQLPGWQNQHSVRRPHGGSDRAEHRVWLHPNCHAPVQNHGFPVVTLRPQPGLGKA